MTGGTLAQPMVQPRRAPWLNRKLLIAGLVLLAAVGVLIYMSMRGNVASYFVTVGGLDQHAAQMNGKTVRVGGNVLPGSIHQGGIDEPLSFIVTDGKHQLPVTYSGDIPDIFTNNTQVVVEGTYHEGGVFQASTLLTKCPSRFTAATSTAAATK